MADKKESTRKTGKGKTTRITIDVPNDLYFDMKQRILDLREKSIKAYMLGLVEMDIKED